MKLGISSQNLSEQVDFAIQQVLVKHCATGKNNILSFISLANSNMYEKYDVEFIMLNCNLKSLFCLEAYNRQRICLFPWNDPNFNSW